MNLQITLAPDGGLRLILPAGRHLDVGFGAEAMHFIKRILMDANAGLREQRGYIGEYPTQHIIEIWKKEDALRKAEQAKEEFAAKGIDLEALDFQL